MNTDFLDLPARTTKPRETGITHVIDCGLSTTEAQGLIETAGEYVDIVKLGWGTAVVAQNLNQKLTLYRQAGFTVVLGGTLTELAIAQDRCEQLLEWLRKLELTHVEISDGAIALPQSDKLALIERLAKEFTVLSEVGSKDIEKIMAPRIWVKQIQDELSAGAWRVIAEARESGNAGIFRASGEVRTGLIDEIAHNIDLGKVIFEAPLKEQQVWFINQFGPDVNLGNIAASDAISLETLRRGLRADTLGLALS